jgi:hypothetical protein
MVVAGTSLCLRLVLRRVSAAAAALLMCVFPPLYAQLVGPSRDGYFLGFTLLAFGFLCAAVRSRRRTTWAALAVAAGIASSLARQNGIATVFAIGGVCAVLACRDPDWRPRRLRGSERRPPAMVGIACATVLTLVSVGATRLVYSAGDVVATRPERMLYIYDLAAITVETDEERFPAELDRRPPGVVPPDRSLDGLERTFEYENVISLYPGGNWIIGDFQDERLAAGEEDLLRDAWWDAVSDEPGIYLRNRLHLTLAQLGLVDRPLDGYLGLVEPTNFGDPPVLSRGYLAANDYITFFVGPKAAVPTDTAWPYVLAASVFGAMLWRRRDRSRVPAAVMVATLWVNIAVMFVIAVAAAFRYMSSAVPICLLTGVFLAAEVALARGALPSVVRSWSAPGGGNDAPAARAAGSGSGASTPASDGSSADGSSAEDEPSSVRAPRPSATTSTAKAPDSSPSVMDG